MPPIQENVHNQRENNFPEANVFGKKEILFPAVRTV